jgi:beta-lactamase superfamily II metal-dependent hydrolase
MQVIKKYNTIKAHAGDTYDILGLKMNVIHGWDSSVDALQDHLCNDGSLMFTLEGNENSMLFCGDVQKEMEETIMSKYMDTLKKVDYVQTGHHGNWGLSTAFYDCFNPKIAFFDSSNALLAENTSYDGYLLKRYFTGRGIKVCNFSTTPNTVVVY